MNYTVLYAIEHKEDSTLVQYNTIKFNNALVIKFRTAKSFSLGSAH